MNSQEEDNVEEEKNINGNEQTTRMVAAARRKANMSGAQQEKTYQIGAIGLGAQLAGVVLRVAGDRPRAERRARHEHDTGEEAWGNNRKHKLEKRWKI